MITDSKLYKTIIVEIVRDFFTSENKEVYKIERGDDPIVHGAADGLSEFIPWLAGT
jgi:hypothetical protein